MAALPVLNAIVTCKRATLDTDGSYSLEGIISGVTLPRMPSPEAPVPFETVLWCDLLATPPVEDGSLFVRIHETGKAVECQITEWKDPERQHYYASFTISAQATGCGPLTLEVWWNDTLLGKHAFELRSPESTFKPVIYHTATELTWQPKPQLVGAES
jgi:hypothetical protein